MELGEVLHQGENFIQLFWSYLFNLTDEEYYNLSIKFLYNMQNEITGGRGNGQVELLMVNAVYNRCKIPVGYYNQHPLTTKPPALGVSGLKI